MSYIAWHFAKSDYTMGYGDGRRLEEGKTYRTIWPCNRQIKPTLYKAGMHGSLRIIDALFYAPGPICCLTEIYGNIVIGDDKIVGESRRILRMIDATSILRLFTRQCALDVIHLWDAPQVFIDYLHTGDETLKAAAAAEAITWGVRDVRAARAAIAARSATGDAMATLSADAVAADARAAMAAGDVMALMAAGDVQNNRLELMMREAMYGH